MRGRRILIQFPSSCGLLLSCCIPNSCASFVRCGVAIGEHSSKQQHKAKRSMAAALFSLASRVRGRWLLASIQALVLFLHPTHRPRRYLFNASEAGEMNCDRPGLKRGVYEQGACRSVDETGRVSQRKNVR